MKRLRSSGRTLPAVVLIALVCAAVWTGSFGTIINQASAATEFLASTWFPAKGSTGVALGVDITVEFNQDVVAETIGPDAFYLTRLGASSPVSEVSISYDTASRVATIDPHEDLLPATVYVVTLTDTIQSETGLPLSNAGDWTFTTDSSPQVLTLSPTAGATNWPTSTNISVTFDKAMKTSTINASSFHLEALGGSSVAAAVSLSSDKRTAILNPTLGLLGGVTYVVTLGDSVRSETGVSVVGTPLEWSFTTVLAPNITSRTPTSGAMNQPANQPVSATFDQDMDQSTLTTATFYVAKYGGSPLPATLAYNVGTRTATLTPLVSYEPGEKYQVTLSTAVKALNGATLSDAPVTWSFNVVADAPTLIVRFPEDGATGVSTSQSIHATFDAAMNASTLTTATFYIQPVGGGPLAASVSYNTLTRTAAIDPVVPLENNKVYQVTLSAAVQGQGGLPVVGSPIIWFFTTEAAANAFSDVRPGLTPYAVAIAELAERGIITGFLDGTFRPYEQVSRQQFAKMIVLALEFPVTGLEVCPFTDVVAQTGSDRLYPLKYVAVCSFRGITQGKTAKSFAPYDSITRQQLITMITRAAEAPTPEASFTAPFTAAQFSTSEHFQNARTAAYAGLLDGLLGVGHAYDFLDGSTRGECAQLLYNLIDYED